MGDGGWRALDCLINPVETSPLRVGTSAGRGTRARNGLQNVARQQWQRGHKRSRRDARSPSAAVRDRMHLIESTSPYNPKLLLARALSESRHRETTRKGAGSSSASSSPTTTRAALLVRQQRLIDKHGVDLWDRITGGHSIPDAIRADQSAREKRAQRLRQRARGEMVAETMHAELSQLLERQLASSASSPSVLPAPKENAEQTEILPRGR